MEKRQTTLKELLYDAAECFSDEPFIRELDGKSFHDTSFAELKSHCDAVGAWIEDNFSEGVHAAVIGATSSEYLTAFFGIQVCGCVSVPLDNANNAERIADEINRSDSTIVFMDDRHAEELEIFRKLCPQVIVFVHLMHSTEGMLFLGDIVQEYAGRIPSITPAPEDLSAILFTSGTTGRSKGVMLRHSNLADNATCEPDLGYRGWKRLSVLPIHHVFCLTCDILTSLWYGRTVCVNDSLMHVTRNLKKFQPDDTTFVPMISASILNRMEQMAENGKDRLEIGRTVFGEDFKVIYSGGAYLSPEITTGFKSFGIDISQGYGMTECSPRICTAVPNNPFPESVGRVVPGCEVKIVDGEIRVKSPSVMKGYYNDPTETAKSLTEDGWLCTGDLGYETDGWLYITGRKKNLIILANGENVSPEEIENQFAFFRPIKEIIVYESQQKITAEIYPEPEYVSNDIQSEIQAKVDKVNETFPPAKRITRIVYRETEFEKTASKKIIRSSVTGP